MAGVLNSKKSIIGLLLLVVGGGGLLVFVVVITVFCFTYSIFSSFFYPGFDNLLAIF